MRISDLSSDVCSSDLAYRTMEIHCSLYECYHSIGDDRNALMHFVRYRAIHDSLEVLKNVKKIGQLHLQYETERKDQQIASLGIINREKKIGRESSRERVCQYV